MSTLHIFLVMSPGLAFLALAAVGPKIARRCQSRRARVSEAGSCPTLPSRRRRARGGSSIDSHALTPNDFVARGWIEAGWAAQGRTAKWK